MLTLRERSGSGDLRSGCGAGQETLRQQAGIQGNPLSSVKDTLESGYSYALPDGTLKSTTEISLEARNDRIIWGGKRPS